MSRTGNGGVASPKSFWGTKCLILGELQDFVWDTASQSTYCLDMLKIIGGIYPGNLQHETQCTTWRSKKQPLNENSSYPEKLNTKS